LLRICQCQV